MRLLALWIVLCGAYAVSLGSEPGGPPGDYLRIADSIVSGGELVRAPEGLGLPVLVAPAYAVGGARAAELLLAAIAALGFVLAALLARRIVPEPYASAAAAVAGLSPPALAYGAAVLPELTAGALLAGAALCAVSAREDPRPGPVLGGAAMLAALPWLGVEYAVPALPVAVALAVWPAGAGRRLLGIAAAEVIVGSLVFYATLNERLYGGPTPNWAGADSLPEYVDRVPRLAGLWLDPEDGLLRRAPFLALAVFAAWLLWRSRRERLARLAPARATAEAAAGLALAVCGGALLVAAFAAPAADRHLAAALPAAAALCAWGLRHAPRVGAALAALTLLTNLKGLSLYLAWNSSAWICDWP